MLSFRCHVIMGRLAVSVWCGSHGPEHCLWSGSTWLEADGPEHLVEALANAVRHVSDRARQGSLESMTDECLL
jgi:hypothetical protein